MFAVIIRSKSQRLCKMLKVFSSFFILMRLLLLLLLLLLMLFVDSLIDSNLDESVTTPARVQH